MTNLLKIAKSFGKYKNEIKLIAKESQRLSSASVMMARGLTSGQPQSSPSATALPKLPVPPLQQTMARLKLAVQPFAKSGEEFENLCKLIDEFSKNGGTGDKLHSLLEHKSSQTANWLSHDWWADKAYLEGRDPILIWSNPGLILPHMDAHKTKSKSFVVQYISRLILSVIDFRESLKNGVNPEVPAGATPPPLCMDQYSKIFGTCRMPGSPIDSIRYGKLDNNEISIVISRLSKFYKIQLSEPSDKEQTLRAIQSAVLYILSQPQPSTSPTEAFQQQTCPANIPFGSFTALPREDSFTAFKLLDENAVNSIVDSEFVVNIDHIQGVDANISNESYYKKMGHQGLHADINNIGNRWFDKTIQLIVATNQEADQIVGSAFCYEHTPAEAGVVVKMMEHAIKQLMSDRTKTDPNAQKIKVDIEELSLVSDQNRERIQSSALFALGKYHEFAKELRLNVLEFREYGKEFIKSAKFSPDSWIQLAMGQAFYRSQGKVGATYESAGTRGFAFGRTETIRSVCNEFVDFYKNPNYHTLKNAIDSHKSLAKNSANGLGIDRTLLGYYCTAMEVKSGRWQWGLSPRVAVNPLTATDYEFLQTLYSNELYTRSKHFQLSTSQVASSAAQGFMCYGPLVTDGYGCCYNPSKEQIIFAISSLGLDTDSFRKELVYSLTSMRDIAAKQSNL